MCVFVGEKSPPVISVTFNKCEGFGFKYFED